MSKDIKWYINVAISLAIMIFFRFIPAPEPMTQMGITVVGLFLGAIYGWCTTNMIWPSLTALVLFAFTGASTTSGAWTSLIGNMSVGFIFWLMLCVGLLQNTRLTEYIATWSITRKFTQGKPWLLFICVFLCTCMGSVFLDGVAVILVFWAIVQNLMTQVGYEKGSKTASWAMFSVVCFCQFGAFVLPFKPAVITCFGFLAAASQGAFDGNLNYAVWIGYTLTITLLIFAVWMLASKFIFRIDLSKFESYDINQVELPPLQKDQKYCLGIFAALMFILLVPSFVPKTVMLGAICSRLGTTGSAMIILAFTCMLRVDGKPLLKFEDLAAKNIVWNVIMMFGTAMVLCSYINSPDAGVSLWLKGLLLPMFQGYNPFVFVAVYLGVCIIITNFINNAVVAALMIPTSYALCVALGVNPIALTASIILFSDYGLLLPSSSPSGSLLYNSNGWIARNYQYLYCIISILIFGAVALFVGWPLGCTLFPWVG